MEFYSFVSMTALQDLVAWQKGMELLTEVQRLSERFPRSERFNLTPQLRKSTKSILANIAEGFSRATDADKAHKYIIARGECTETYGHLLIAIGLNYITQESAAKALGLTQHVGKLLTGLIKKFS